MNFSLRFIFLTLAGLYTISGIAAQQAATVSATGPVTDTICGAKGVGEKHADCAKRNVASGKAKYAIYDEATKRLYILEPASTAVQYAGQHVKITGTVSATLLKTSGQGYDATAQKVVSYEKALDASTPIAGILTITSVELAPEPI